MVIICVFLLVFLSCVFRQDQALYAKIINRNTIFLIGSNLNYNVSNCSHIKSLLIQNSFNRISGSCYVNTLQMQEYNFKERKIELSNGGELTIEFGYMNKLMIFFSNRNSNLKQL